MKRILLVLLLCIPLTACDNVMVKTFGGTMEVTLEQGERLENITWKTTGSKADTSSLWLHTTLDNTNEPRTHVFRESSAFGIFEGTVIIHEK